MSHWFNPALIDVHSDLVWVASRLADGLRGGQHRATRRGRGIEFAQHRSYDRGDDIRLVDWRAYARSDRLLIREAETEADHRYWLLIDTSASMAMTGANPRFSKLDAARVLAATMAALAERQGDDYALASLGTAAEVELPPGQGRGWFTRLIARLDRLRSGGRAGIQSNALLSTIGGDNRNTDVLIISDAYQRREEWTNLARQLSTRRHAVSLVCLETALERDFTLSEPRWFRDLESGRLVATDASQAARYRQAREAYLESLHRSLASFGAGFQRLTIDEDWEPQLRRLLAER